LLHHLLLGPHTMRMKIFLKWKNWEKINLNAISFN